MKNIFLDDLSGITFEEMLTSLEAIARETQRVDFKRVAVGRPKLAHLACAFANADGGIIAIGFSDPQPNEPLQLLDVVDVSDKTRLSLVAAMNACVHPPLPMEIGAYVDSTGSRSFMAIRVERSEVAPHEYIRADQSINLPVRRDTQTGALRLSEIYALGTRSAESINESPLGQKAGSERIYLQQGSTEADISFRIGITPMTYSRHRRIFVGEDDRALGDLVGQCRGKHATFFGDLAGHPYMDGVHFYAGEQPTWMGPDSTSHFASHQITIDSDGEIRLRFLQDERNPSYVQYLFATGAAYLLAQRSFYYLELAPFARLNLQWRLRSDPSNRDTAYHALPEYFSDYWTVDLAAESFSDAVIDQTNLMLRAAGTVINGSDLRNSLERFEQDNVPDLRSQWQVSP